MDALYALKGIIFASLIYVKSVISNKLLKRVYIFIPNALIPYSGNQRGQDFYIREIDMVSIRV